MQDIQAGPAHRKRRLPVWLRPGGILAGCGLLLLLLTGGYIITGINSWFGDIKDPAERTGTDASVFLSESFAHDFNPVSWINTNIDGQPVMLEAPGDDFSGYQRISVSTGLPTVIGWYVHEWLWRSNYDEVEERIRDVGHIYTSEDSVQVIDLVRKYHVDYIYVGTLEREKYPDLKDEMLKSLGDIVYDDGTTYIVRVR